ncbi:hypothetical protein CRP01_30830 [Flavilitoribacter nigricans DSM 23189 = NBRC 102662]|uniref:Uncharacterized protein n=1 Tax=Flavilitoribacter nigricans (strain ATCC 23147 / DSM 23189 / NBRC 102662 / NCIMB 1420 / SS-2) TaxID=1122177 RepID=A0A2D0N4R8_FLAN2|nr:hypothetical protein CRP01_30830 [Flavilitoribacter nigricans DSM 23189 = NBRC 102662]
MNAGFLQASISFKDADRAAAWDMYIELLTRVTTQYLEPEHGDEKSALDSFYALFGLTREVIKKNGPNCINFAKLAIVILNQVIRPFTAKWHKLSLAGAFADPVQCLLFRQEMEDLQTTLRKYTVSLADIAGVEDLTDFEIH